MVIEKTPGWIRYHETKAGKTLDIHKSGKWMYFFEAKDVAFARNLCCKAIENHVVTTCKHTDIQETGFDTGVICFYIHFDDVEAHKKVLGFFLENNLIQRTKAGMLKNISFKLDEQTLAREYGDKFKAKICLSDFVDLSTGKWISN